MAGKPFGTASAGITGVRVIESSIIVGEVAITETFYK